MGVFVGSNAGRAAVGIGNSAVGDGRGVGISRSEHPTNADVANAKLIIPINKDLNPRAIIVTVASRLYFRPGA